MTPVTVAKYLVGSRGPILQLARDRRALAVGALLVLSASLARNYDGAYLLAEWRVLLHGIAVSAVNAFLLFTLVHVAGTREKPAAPYGSGLLAFLGLFWMTSPMAWAYAVPYERFLEPAAAVEANLWTLKAVSVWRVALMTRVLSVIFAVRARRVFWLVMLFSDVALLAGLLFSPMPVLDLMGGLQQSPEDAKLASATFETAFLAVVTFPVWLIGAAIASAGLRVGWAVGDEDGAERPWWRPMAVACGCVAAWVGVAAVVQPEQARRWEAERLLRAGEVDAAILEMSRHDRGEYPPIWDPPPRPTWHVNEPSIEALRAGLVRAKGAAWVEEVLWEKCWMDLGRAIGGWREWPLERLSPDWAHRTSPEWWTAAALHAEHDPRLTETQRAALWELVRAYRGEEADDVAESERTGEGDPG